MRSEQDASRQQMKRHAVEKAYLLYYNRVLYEKGLITERERNRMIHQISHRSGAAHAGVCTRSQ